MLARDLVKVCDEAVDGGRYVSLVHRGIRRDVYPFRIRDERLYCWCSLHPDTEVEGMYLSNISSAEVSDKSVGFLFGYDTDFGTQG